MKNIFYKIILIALIFTPAVSFATVSKIIFVTDPQTIKPDTLSDQIKVQFQDSSGNPISFGETEQMILESSSNSSGEKFFNSSGNSISETVNSNWTSRTFYYKDSDEGTFTITASISGTDLTASQEIVVSSSASESSLSSSDSSDSDNSNSSGSSIGSSLTSVSTYGKKLEVLAGEDRVATPGSPIWFQSFIKKNSTGEPTLDFHWSFGDGYVGTNEKVSHTYKYPGDYVVVLTVTAGEFVSTSRLKVRVSNTSVSVNVENNFIEIKNNSDSELNIFKWKLESGGKAFVFQPDTIILPKSSIKVDKSLLNLKADDTENTSLENAFGEKLFSKSNKSEEEISTELETLKSQAYNLVSDAISSKLVSEISPEPEYKMQNTASVATFQDNAQEQNINENKKISENKTETNSQIIYESQKAEGLFTRLTNFIKGVFSK